MQEREIFLNALEYDNLIERADFLDRVCGNDLKLRERLEVLLRADVVTDGFLQTPVKVFKDGPFHESPLVESQGLADMSASGAASSDETLTFLTPSTEPGSLGRLDHYEVLEFVGKGGTGVVLRARDTKLLRVVAIKLLAASLAASGSARQRFAREARAAACIRDDHVTAIYAVEDRAVAPYLVMEFIDGCTLDDRLRRGGSLEVKEVLRIGIQIASGLAAAHKQGLVHRDIKPANILLENGVQRVKLTDFGLARTADDASLTQSGYIAGTPLYMSPEQANGEAIDYRSDLFSLGSVLYEMCTGRPAFRAANTTAVLRRVCEDTPRPIREVNPDIPDSLCRVIEQLQAKKPTDRPESANEVANILSRLLVRLQGQIPEHSSATTNLASPKPARASVPETAQRRGLSFQMRRWIAVALVLLAAGIALGETTNVTNVRGTVIRLFSPEGTLVVEVDDPGVNVTVEGRDVVIANTGAGEIRLKPGQYKVDASLEGKLVHRELITITRNGRRVVRLSQESASSTATARSAPVLKQTLLGHTTGVMGASFSPNGRLYASGDVGGVVRVWDMPAGTLRYVLPPSGTRIHAISFSPDGKSLVTACEHQSTDIRIFAAETGKPEGVLKGHTGGLFELAFSADGKTLVSAGWDATVRVWDFKERREVRSFVAPDKRWIRSVAIANDGGIAVGGGMLFFLQPDAQLHRTLDKHVGPVCFSPDGRLLAGTTWKEGRVTLWDAKTADQVSSWRAHNGYANSVVFSPIGKVLATAGNDRNIRIWEVATQRLLGEAQHDGDVSQLAFSPDGMTLASSGTEDRLVKLWDVSYLQAIGVSEKSDK